MSKAPTRRDEQPSGLFVFFRKHPAALPVLSFALLMTIWELAGRGGNPLLTSHPSAVFNALVTQVSSGILLRSFLQSLQPLLIGYGFAVLFGIPIGLLLKRSEDYDTAGMFVPAFVFMAMGIVANYFLVAMERRIAPWHKATSAGNE